ncbi:YugN family protein [Virgibacillus doumboii]|uniref:YugN family protein n=1 Tax=Virgibacillus doumboii TaxID=2697503 RepID=UPI0013DFB5FA|nr:YugN family protein [Virgibacillus doumboii]
MIELETELEGKRTHFGTVQDYSKQLNYTLGGCWDYHKGCIDSILWRDGGETIYLRLSVKVIKGELDRPNALIEFEKPYVIKHVVNTGLDRDVNSLATVSGFSQFQDPLDQDGLIRDKKEWQENGEQAVDRILNQVSFI